MQDTWCAGVIGILGGVLVIVGTMRRSPWWMRFSKTETVFEILGPVGGSTLYYAGGALMIALGVYFMFGVPR